MSAHQEEQLKSYIHDLTSYGGSPSLHRFSQSRPVSCADRNIVLGSRLQLLQDRGRVGALHRHLFPGPAGGGSVGQAVLENRSGCWIPGDLHGGRSLVKKPQAPWRTSGWKETTTVVYLKNTFLQKSTTLDTRTRREKQNPSEGHVDAQSGIGVAASNK